MVYFRFQDAHIRQIPVMLIIIQTIAHHKFIGDGEANPVALDLHTGLPAFGFIQQSASMGSSVILASEA